MSPGFAPSGSRAASRLRLVLPRPRLPWRPQFECRRSDTCSAGGDVFRCLCSVLTCLPQVTPAAVTFHFFTRTCLTSVHGEVERRTAASATVEPLNAQTFVSVCVTKLINSRTVWTNGRSKTESPLHMIVIVIIINNTTTPATTRNGDHFTFFNSACVPALLSACCPIVMITLSLGEILFFKLCEGLAHCRPSLLHGNSTDH